MTNIQSMTVHVVLDILLRIQQCTSYYRSDANQSNIIQSIDQIKIITIWNQPDKSQQNNQPLLHSIIIKGASSHTYINKNWNHPILAPNLGETVAQDMLALKISKSYKTNQRQDDMNFKIKQLIKIESRVK